MTNNYASSSSSGKKRSSQPRPARRGAAQSRNSFGSGRKSARSQQRRIKTFNPSDFIKSVKEQTEAPKYEPKHLFADFLIEEQLKKNIARRGYTAPTPIQDQAIPLLLEGKDLIGTANTGTGKTAAFLIPMINNLLQSDTARALIVTPTRELAAQIQEELQQFKEHTGLTSALCIGGLSYHLQTQKLARNPAFVIGTPGRLKDLSDRGLLHFSDYTSIVLDEADTMLDMGFINDIKYIIEKLPKKRHSLFFSATMSPAIEKIADRFLTNPVFISVKSRQTAENVNQDIVRTSNKIETLHELLITPELRKVIIFSRTKHATDKLSKKLQERGFDLATIHGNKSQMQRKKALRRFKDNDITILLATDVVARGIDIDDISHVINFDLPQTPDDYIHRIGRTGRANKIGQALTFIDG